jgi:hypothetical protein
MPDPIQSNRSNHSNYYDEEAGLCSSPQESGGGATGAPRTAESPSTFPDYSSAACGECDATVKELVRYAEIQKQAAKDECFTQGMLTAVSCGTTGVLLAGTAGTGPIALTGAVLSGARCATDVIRLYECATRER